MGLYLGECVRISRKSTVLLALALLEPLVLIPGPVHLARKVTRDRTWDQFRMILISKYNYRLKPKMNILVFDIYGIILYSVIMSKVKKYIKVLARKAAGLNRKEKVQEMKKGLSALGLVAMRQRRDGGLWPYISFEDLDAVDQILKRASVRR